MSYRNMTALIVARARVSVGAGRCGESGMRSKCPFLVQRCKGRESDMRSLCLPLTSLFLRVEMRPHVCVCVSASPRQG